MKCDFLINLIRARVGLPIAVGVYAVIKRERNLLSLACAYQVRQDFQRVVGKREGCCATLPRWLHYSVAHDLDLGEFMRRAI